MLNRFVSYIEKEHLIAEGQQVLLAVSGGRDSVAMCELVARAGFPFAIAHCNFHLRPGECDRDEAFVHRLAQRYQVPCYTAQFDTEDYARREKRSVEDAARKLRYGFFEQVRADKGYHVIATAHHQDDAVETFFINLLRGTGIGGLHGILPRNGHVVRPMLCFSRGEIDRFVRENNLDFVEDCTNAQPLYLRNRIRLQLVPLLRELSPSFDAVMQGNLVRLSEAGQLYGVAVRRMRDELLSPVGNGFAVDVERLSAYGPLRTILFELLHPFGFSSAVVDDLAEALDGQSGSTFLSPTHRVVKDRGRLLVVPLEDGPAGECLIGEEVTAVQTPVNLRLWMSPPSQEPIRLPADEACFDCDRVRFPLLLRRWRHGDRFRPFGMKGSRLVSDFLIDAKVSRVEKERVCILCDADGVVLWVVGLRAAAVAVVNDATRRVLHVKCCEPPLR